MGNHSHTPVDVDPQAINEAKKLWNGFTVAITYGVLAVVVILLAMYFTLV